MRYSTYILYSISTTILATVYYYLLESQGRLGSQAIDRQSTEERMKQKKEWLTWTAAHRTCKIRNHWTRLRYNIIRCIWRHSCSYRWQLLLEELKMNPLHPKILSWWFSTANAKCSFIKNTSKAYKIIFLNVKMLKYN